jgi:hypothetical protein
VHVENEIEFLERPAASRAPDDVTKELYSYDLCIDGERVDVADTRRELRAGDAQPTPAFCMRTIWDGKREIHRQRYLGGDGKSEVEPSVGRRHGDFRISYSAGGFLYGFALGDERPMVRVLRDAGNATLRPKREDVDGHACQVVEGSTERGTYAVWLDAAADFQVRRAVVVRKPGDRVFDEKLPQRPTDSKYSHLECRIDKVDLQRVGENWLPMRAVMETRARYATGQEVMRATAARSKLELHPDFAALGAFVMDGIPNGADVAIMGDDGVQSGTTTWRDGDVEAEAFRGVKE